MSSESTLASSSGIISYSIILTVSEYLEGRFGASTRVMFSLISLFSYVVTKISATLYGGALLFQVVFPGVGSVKSNNNDGNINNDGNNDDGNNVGNSRDNGDNDADVDDGSLYVWCFFLIILCSIYTILGGLRAVMITDGVQLLIFFFGGFLAVMIALNRIKGWKGLREAAPLDQNPQYLKLGRYGVEAQKRRDDMQFPGALCIFIFSFWYWNFDQFIVQRVLSGKSLSDVKKGCILAGFLKLFSPLLLCVPGMVARGLYENCISNLKTHQDQVHHHELTTSTISTISEDSSDFERTTTSATATNTNYNNNNNNNINIRNTFGPGTTRTTTATIINLNFDYTWCSPDLSSISGANKG